MSEGIGVSRNVDEFEYDVAFSFHGADEGLASQLNDLLADRMKTFIYSERQRELAGTDGQESFSAIYGKTARIVVVLYRESYGKTRWTRVEMDAIKNRSLDDGWDFTVFIPTEKTPSVPAWLPKTRLYVGLERWGLQGAAAAIEARVTDRGGRPHEESIQDRAARFARTRKLEELRRQFERSDKGVNAALAAYDELTAAVDRQCADLREANVAVKLTSSNHLRIVGGLNPVNLIFSFRPTYSNTLEDALLKTSLYKGFPRLPGFYPSLHEARTLKTHRYSYELFREDSHGYVALDEGRREFTPELLASHLLRQYMDMAEQIKSDY